MREGDSEVSYRTREVRSIDKMIQEPVIPIRNDSSFIRCAVFESRPWRGI
jgi:hypothetical protein